MFWVNGIHRQGDRNCGSRGGTSHQRYTRRLYMPEIAFHIFIRHVRTLAANINTIIIAFFDPCTYICKKQENAFDSTIRLSSIAFFHVCM